MFNHICLWFLVYSYVILIIYFVRNISLFHLLLIISKTTSGMYWIAPAPVTTLIINYDFFHFIFLLVKCDFKYCKKDHKLKSREATMESHICWLQWLTFYADDHNFFHIIPHRKISGLATRTRWFMIFYLLVLWVLLMFVFRWFSSPVLLWPSRLLEDGKKQMNECSASHSIQFEYGSIINEEKITRK